jgi:hypothetical protein
MTVKKGGINIPPHAKPKTKHMKNCPNRGEESNSKKVQKVPKSNLIRISHPTFQTNQSSKKESAK